MMLLKMPHTLVLLAVVSLSACSTNSGSVPANDQTTISENSLAISGEPTNVRSDISIEFLRIKHHQVECEGFHIGHCLLVQREGSDDWEYFYDQIEGFEYQWGTNYDVLVQVQELQTEMADASNQQYSLLEVVSSTEHEASDAFDYIARNTHERITEITPGQFSLLGNKVFTCTAENCGIIRSVIDQRQTALLSFQHSNNSATPLVLAAILCVDAAESFNASCL